MAKKDLESRKTQPLTPQQLEELEEQKHEMTKVPDKSLAKLDNIIMNRIKAK